MMLLGGRRWCWRGAVALLVLALGAWAEAALADEAAAGDSSGTRERLRGGAGYPARQTDTAEKGRSLDDGSLGQGVLHGEGDVVPEPGTTPEPLPTAHPNALQWVLAAVLVSLLLAHLARIWRVLRGENTLVLQHSAPDGMRTVQCGQCRKMQYLQISVRNFICYNCTATNRLTVDLLRTTSGSPLPELVENTGPCKKFEFRRQGNLYWQLLKEELEDGQVTDLTAEPEKSGEVDTERDGQPVEAGPWAEVPQAQVADATTASAEQGPDELAEATTSATGTGEDAEVAAGEWESCGVCWDNPGYMVLLPCSHGNVCEYCATRIAQNRATGGSHCPHCRADITMLVKLTELHADNHEVRARGVEHRVPIARVLGAPTST